MNRLQQRRQQSRRVFAWMAALAGKMADLCTLELNSWGGNPRQRLFALDYQPPIFLEPGTTIPVAFCAKIRYKADDSQQTVRTSLYWVNTGISAEDLAGIPDNSALFTQVAYQCVRQMRAKIVTLNSGRFVPLDHNEGLTSTMQAAGQRILV